jgi:hypothetical protein
MKLKTLLARLDAIQQAQSRAIENEKPSPKVYEGLLNTDVREVLRMFDNVDAQMEAEKIDELIKRLKADLKAACTKK